MNKTLIEGGHWDEKGYYYKIYLNFPFWESVETVNMHNRRHKVKKFTANTGFLFTSNPIYVNINIVILGFGLGFEVQSKE